MVEPNCPWSSAGSVKRGSPFSARFTLKVVPFAPVVVDPRVPRRGEARPSRPGPASGTDRRSPPPPRSRISLPERVRTASTPDAAHRDLRHRMLGEDRAPRAARASSASRVVTVPIPPRTIIQVPSAPGSRHMLWPRKLCPLPGVSQVPVSPLTPSVTAYIALSRSLLNSKRSRYSPDRAPAEGDEGLAQRGPDVPLGGVLDGQRLLAARWARRRRGAGRSRPAAPGWRASRPRRRRRWNCSFIAAWSEPKSR